jgi:ATP-dependent helicase/nuclease subunit B
VPHEKKIKAGYAPQLSLEGLMAEIGAFGGASGPVAGLEYWAIRGYGEPGEITPIKDHAARIAEAAQGLTALIRRFRDPETPYLSQPAPEAALYHEYDHLARVGEWREGGGE